METCPKCGSARTYKREIGKQIGSTVGLTAGSIGGFVAAGYAGSGVFVTTVDVSHIQQHELISQLTAGAILNTVREGIPR